MTRTLKASGLLLIAVLASPAAAQTPDTQPARVNPPQNSLILSGSFGYLVAHNTGAVGRRAPGWIWSIDGVINDKYAIVGEFAGGARANHSSLVGARVILPSSKRISPFVQVLAGKGRSSLAVDNASAFTIQPGAGVQLSLIPHLAVRLQGDYDWRRGTVAPGNAFRLGISIVIH